MDVDSEIYETELSFAENALVISAFIWLQQHPDAAEWEQSRTSQYIEQCVNKPFLRHIWENCSNEVSVILFFFSVKKCI